MSRTPGWLIDLALTGANWCWRNRWLLAMLAATSLLIAVMIYRSVAE